MTATPVFYTQVIYKIDIPANRYDMLCLEASALPMRSKPCKIADTVADGRFAPRRGSLVP